MKFIKLTYAKDDKITYTVNINNIACIETSVREDGTVQTWIQGQGFENGELYVKETEEQIVKALERQQAIERILKNAVR
nr:MAG TPA: hypothetical protein [Caudoviricetes sp.]